MVDFVFLSELGSEKCAINAYCIYWLAFASNFQQHLFRFCFPNRIGKFKIIHYILFIPHICTFHIYGIYVHICIYLCWLIHILNYLLWIYLFSSDSFSYILLWKGVNLAILFCQTLLLADGYLDIICHIMSRLFGRFHLLHRQLVSLPWCVCQPTQWD